MDKSLENLFKIFENWGDGKETFHTYEFLREENEKKESNKRNERSIVDQQKINKLKKKVRSLQKRNQFEHLTLKTAKMIDQYFGIASEIKSIRPAQTDREKRKIQKLLKKAEKMQNVLMKRIANETGQM